MRNISVLFFSLFYLSTSSAESWFFSNNSVSTGKVIINGQDMSDPNSSMLKGSGVKETIHRKISDFSAISIQGGFDIQYTQGEKPSLSITGDDNIIKDVITTVNGSTLHLSINKSFSSSLPIHIVITSPKLSSVKTNGSSDIELNEIKTERLELELNGSVDLHANGTATELNINLTGAGDANIKSLTTKIANVDIKGSGDINLTVTQTLNANIFGSGDIVYFGHPSSVNKKVFGAGDIESGD